MQIRSRESEFGGMLEEVANGHDLLQWRAALREGEELAGKMSRVLRSLTSL